MRYIPKNIDAVIGTQWGDEGKGKIIDHLASSGRYDMIARAAGGPNAGHTIYVDGTAYKFHGLPEGALYPEMKSLIGPGAVIDPVKLVKEINHYGVQTESLLISQNCHLITPCHVSQDEIREAGDGKQGSTKSGMAYVSADKYAREGVPLGFIESGSDEIKTDIENRLMTLNRQRSELGLPLRDPMETSMEWIEAARQLLAYMGDTTLYINRFSEAGGRILASGAQSHWLDINEQPYPWGSSTHTGIGGIVDGLKVPPQSINRIVGVMKGFKSRVGGGPFITEITDEDLAARLRRQPGQPGAEYGTTSGRARRVGYLDLPEVKRSVVANGLTELALTKLDELHLFGRSMLIAANYLLTEDRCGLELDIATNQTSDLMIAEPLYEEIELWDESESERITVARKFSDLPEAARKLVTFIEETLEVDVRFIGTGPNRHQIVVR